MTRSDAVVIVLMIILLSFVYSTYWSFSNDHDTKYAQVSITNNPPQRILLNQDKVITLNGRIGSATIQIENKKIRFINSPCTKKYCIHSGWLKNTGSIASCIPNGITLSIKSTKNLFDAINF